MNGIGIDFGTTNSVVAICEERTGRTRGLADPENNLPHPSVVGFRGDKVEVGRSAKHQIQSLAEVAGNFFVRSVKRELGKGKRYSIFGEEKTASDVAAEIFRFLKTRARKDHKVDVETAVVTVPVHCDGRARRELRKAAADAGVHIKTFIHEPFSAVVGYCKNARQDVTSFDGSRILVFDWGGGTLDVTLVQIRGGLLAEIGTGALDDIAGDHFDGRIGDHVVSRFVETPGFRADLVAPHGGTRARLWEECERGKIALSNTLDTKVQVAQLFRGGGRDFDLDEPLDRPGFEKLIRQDVDAAFHIVDRVLTDARVTESEVTRVLLIGGTSQIPVVRQEMEKRFGARLVEVPNADTIIAEGAAIVAQEDLCPFLQRPVQIRLADETLYTVYEAGTLAIPDGNQKSLTLFCTDNRDGMAHLVIAERLRSGDPSSAVTKDIVDIGVSPKLPAPYEHERVYATFSIDRDLVLQVRAHSATQQKLATAEIYDLAFGLRAR